ncbi:MAG: aspartate aminotransferase family protein [Oscillospiraceae bacterium]|nr:aspartate aminotransferase family protein [Candidatus Ruminococcus equi]
MNIKELDKKYVASTYGRFDIEIVKGKGSLVYDENGKEYIDLTSGIGVNIFGVCDDKICEAIENQAKTLTHISNLFYTKPCVELAQMLCEKTGMSKVFFSNSGAEANECAIKIARKYAQSKKGEEYFNIITLENSFHGRTLTTLAATGQESFHTLYTPLTDGFVSTKANDLDAFIKLAESTKCAGIMLETVQGEGGVNVLDFDFVKGVEKYAKENDIILIIDEVQTGNGRTGKLYSYMNYGITPDVVSTAKGLAGGLPLGATLMSQKVKDVFNFGDHGSTFGGNPICCASALSVLSRIDDNLLQDVNKKSEYIFSELENAEGVESISGKGLMLGIKAKQDAKRTIKRLQEKGVLCLSAKDKVRLLPPLNIEFSLLQKAVEIIKETLKEEL